MINNETHSSFLKEFFDEKLEEAKKIINEVWRVKSENAKLISFERLKKYEGFCFSIFMLNDGDSSVELKLKVTRVWSYNFHDGSNLSEIVNKVAFDCEVVENASSLNNIEQGANLRAFFEPSSDDRKKKRVRVYSTLSEYEKTPDQDRNNSTRVRFNENWLKDEIIKEVKELPARRVLTMGGFAKNFG